MRDLQTATFAEPEATNYKTEPFLDQIDVQLKAPTINIDSASLEEI
jgi:hypothetical protein